MRTVVFEFVVCVVVFFGRSVPLKGPLEFRKEGEGYAAEDALAAETLLATS